MCFALTFRRKMRASLRATFLAAACALLARAAPPALIDVYASGEFGYACFRIPALIALTNGSLLLFAEGRRYSCADHGFVDLVVRASSDGGASWGALRVVRSESTPQKNVTIGNAAPLALSGNRVLLPFCRDNAAAGVLYSADGGGSWSLRTAALPVAADWTWIATGPPGSAQLASGRVLVPANRIVGGVDASFVYYSDDEGASWKMSQAVAKGNEAQAALLPWLGAGAVLLSMRNAVGGGFRLAALSSDAGATFGAPWETIAETACEASTLALPQHAAGPRLVMSSAFAASRTNMTLHVSSDAGRSWAPAARVYEGSAAYSSLAPSAASPSAVVLAFERDGYAKISLVQRIDV